MLKMRIDGREISASDGSTILQAALASGIDIPHFCYHPAFVPEGSCRMCLVEIEGAPRLDLACSTKVKEAMSILTTGPKVAAARREVLEVLLAEHPLDCPICDKANECLLQDYYDKYGRTAGRFREPKDVREKLIPIGRGLLLDRERCVLCTRCVRFLREVTKGGELGIFARGARSEVGLNEDRKIDNDYSGNLGEICPVGAITDRDFRFRTRPWRLAKGDTICPHCGRGCNIIVEYRSASDRSGETREVFRIKARENPRVNGFWICDRGRYARSHWSGERIKHPLMVKPSGRIRMSWDKALIVLSEKIRGTRSSGAGRGIGLILNTFLSNEELGLVRRVFGDAVKAGNAWFADPKPGAADNLLLTAERAPNVRGARDLGFEPGPPDLDVISAKSGLLLIFGTGLLEHCGEGEICGALDSVQSRFLFSARSSEMDGSMNFILPSALIAEKSGSLTNVDGVVQEFRPVWDPPGEARAVGDVLAALAGIPGIANGGGLG
jgi:NADH-quinone oxidoreductase subunit G